MLARTEDLDHIKAADALTLLLNGEADADNTAERITKIYEADLKRNNGSTYADGHNKVYEFWMNHMCNAILKFGNSVVHQRLIELLEEISRQPEVRTPDGCEKMYEGCEVYWRDVPGWEYSFADDILCKLPYCVAYKALLMAQIQTTRDRSSTLSCGRTTTLLKLRAF